MDRLVDDSGTDAARSPPQIPVPAEVEVLVVGYGPVGAAIANLLGRYGVRVLAVDKAQEIFMAPRAIALDNEALRILQLAGLEDGDFQTVAIPQVRMLSPRLGEFGRLNTLGPLDGHPRLVTFYQPELEAALRGRAAQYRQVHTALGVTLAGFVETPDGVVATLDVGAGATAAVRARYLVGADGAGSLVRRLIGQAFDGRTYGEDWLIVDARGARHPIDHVEFLCDHRRPTPHMTAPGGRERWEFMLRPGETRADMESDARVSELLAPWGGPAAMTVERKAVYRFHARAAKSFRKGRVFLAGDAAHITPPFAGQGLVAGLRDAANLAWKIAWVVQGRAAPAILDSYDEERRPHAKAMIDLAKLMGRVIMPRSAAVALLTHGLLRLTRLTAAMRRYVDDLGIKPKNVFPRGLFVPGRSGSKLTRGGPLPQGWVRGPDGAVRLSDDVLGSGLTLVGFGRDPRDGLTAATARAFAACGGAMVQIAHRGQARRFRREDSWEDLDGTFLPGAAPCGWAAVVRPDRTVLHDGPVAEADRLVSESLALIGTPVRAEAPSGAVPALTV
ncbi:3-(3-hydroxy-phenyl)propionate hydroxylase [Roseiarcus fermentans]|uniref:3-(3-hydroxy-phenyl)propionate hydroxylase n=1 Tax=Roseiarcus fermentans TaxID=1473586 RepID=A0A366FXD8_9HYPH|nr:bifunctional 3-(3-hydroxy-phenyl)propionate/3-hydroxycinnamic acid hydroxylase [Roseiarcus fermentans]RBP18369.1 3-(3-hydroxy-phenyl)propionate hydroxylase [Roseiarcus fermentans]